MKILYNNFFKRYTIIYEFQVAYQKLRWGDTYFFNFLSVRIEAGKIKKRLMKKYPQFLFKLELLIFNAGFSFHKSFHPLSYLEDRQWRVI